MWKHNVQIKGNLETRWTNSEKNLGRTMYNLKENLETKCTDLKFEGTCANTRYKFQMEFGSIVKKGKGKFGETNVQCTTHNSQESLECIH